MMPAARAKAFNIELHHLHPPLIKAAQSRAYFGSTSPPPPSHASNPPFNALTRLKPICLKISTPRALRASFGHVQYVTISASLGRAAAFSLNSRGGMRISPLILYRLVVYECCDLRSRI